LSTEEETTVAYGCIIWPCTNFFSISLEKFAAILSCKMTSGHHTLCPNYHMCQCWVKTLYMRVSQTKAILEKLYFNIERQLLSGSSLPCSFLLNGKIFQGSFLLYIIYIAFSTRNAIFMSIRDPIRLVWMGLMVERLRHKLLMPGYLW
jgi:hypothetical protein